MRYATIDKAEVWNNWEDTGIESLTERYGIIDGKEILTIDNKEVWSIWWETRDSFESVSLIYVQFIIQ